MKRTTFFKYLLILILIIIVSIYFSETPKKVLLSFDVEEINTPEEVNFVLEELKEVNANATFFIQEEFALKNRGLIKNISKKYEVASYSIIKPQLQGTNPSKTEDNIKESKRILENISNKSIFGIRVPYNGLNEEVIKILKNNYQYDASTFSGYSWFFPKIPKNIKEVPISTLLFIPMEDIIFSHYLKIGDLGFFLMSYKRKKVVSIDFHPQQIQKHKLAFNYLLKKYYDKGAEFLSHKNYLKTLEK